MQLSVATIVISFVIAAAILAYIIFYVLKKNRRDLEKLKAALERQEQEAVFHSHPKKRH